MFLNALISQKELEENLLNKYSVQNNYLDHANFKPIAIW
jgi:hypothetical protein